MTTAPAVLDVAASHQALLDLRHARRHNHRAAVHWVDALYRVYISGLAAVLFVVVGAGAFGTKPIALADAQAFATHAVPWLGLVFALAAGTGMRSGSRGGPLTLQAPTVHHELMAPVDRGVVLREPALKLLRFLGFSGACVGAVVATTGARQLPVNAIALVGGAAAAFALALVGAAGLAMICSGRRVGRLPANVLALALMAWSVADIVLGTETSPFTLLGRLAFAAFSFTPLVVVPVILALATVPVALTGLGGTSIDDARRRAGLVAQLRFAVTLQDIRTVVLLRRQLAQEKPRGRPWVRLRRRRRNPTARPDGRMSSLARMNTVWRRDWASYLRFPAVRLLRLVAFAAVAGAALGATWNGVRPAFLVAALALYLAAYDAVEPLAQEVDHPSRWDAMPEDHGIILLYHLPAAVALMVVVCAIAAAVALVFVPASVVWSLAGLLLWIVAFASVAGAALSTVMGSPDMAKMMAGPGADMMGFILLFRVAFPPAITVAALAPMFAVGVDADHLDLARAQNLAGYSVILAGLAVAYIRFRKPSRI